MKKAARGKTRMFSPEQMTLVVIVSEKYAVIQDVATSKTLVPGCALDINVTVMAPTTGRVGTLNAG